MTDGDVAASFWSSSLAGRWDQGVVVGGGTVGAVVHGSPERHTITLSHERFFLPANSRRPAPDLAPALADIRAAALAGDTALAERLVAGRVAASGYDGELIWTDPLAPCAALSWAPDRPAGGWRDYRRDVDLSTGEATLSWDAGAGAGEPEAAVSRSGLSVLTPRGTETVIVEVWSAAGGSGLLVLGPVEEDQPSGIGVGAVNYSDRTTSHADSSRGRLRFSLSSTGVEPGTGVVVTTTVDVSGPAPAVTASSAPAVAASPASPVRTASGNASIAVALEPGIRRRFVVRVALGASSSLLEAAGPPVELAPTIELRAEQRRSHGQLVARSRLDLHSGVDPSGSTEQVWAAARRGEPAALRAVVERTYAAGRHNIISATGELPPTLQGVWQGTWTPAWSADYTMNGNVQNGVLAGAIWTGTPELIGALFRLVLPFVADYRSNARRVLGAGGMLLPARMSTHGHLNHFIPSYPHEFWIGSGGWFLRFAYDYLITTGDREPLDSWLWGFAVEVLRCYEAALVEPAGQTGGCGHLAPSFSPENTPLGAASPLAVDATMDVAIIRDAVRVGLELAELVGDHRHDARWVALLAALPPYRIGPDGALAEWLDPAFADRVAHRHASQLYPLWYELDPELAQSGDLRRAAEVTVGQKVEWRAQDPTPPPGRMEMAFGLHQVGAAAAALGDARSAWQCVTWLARDHWTPAMVSLHDGGAIFGLDASGSLPAVVAAMLLGSTRAELALLPAVPAAWPTGTVTGLIARGGLVVDRLAWSQSGAELTAHAVPGTAWLRPAVTTIRLPHPSRLAPGTPGANLRSDRELELEFGAGPVSIEMFWIG